MTRDYDGFELRNARARIAELEAALQQAQQAWANERTARQDIADVLGEVLREKKGLRQALEHLIESPVSQLQKYIPTSQVQQALERALAAERVAHEQCVVHEWNPYFGCCLACGAKRPVAHEQTTEERWLASGHPDYAEWVKTQPVDEARDLVQRLRGFTFHKSCGGFRVREEPLAQTIPCICGLPELLAEADEYLR